MHDPEISGEPVDHHEAAGRVVDADTLARFVELYLRDPEAACYWDGRPLGGRERTPMLLLVTRGRRTGRLLTRPLAYIQDGERYVVVGTRGEEQPPSWIFNVQANPLVEVQVVRDRFPAQASFVSGAERERLWPLLVDIYPPYREFQARCTGEIPVVVLTRVHIADR